MKQYHTNIIQRWLLPLDCVANLAKYLVQHLATVECLIIKLMWWKRTVGAKLQYFARLDIINGAKIATPIST